MSWSQIPIRYPFITKDGDDTYQIKSMSKPKAMITIKGTRPERNLIIARNHALKNITSHADIQKLASITRNIQEAMKRANIGHDLPTHDINSITDVKSMRKYIQEFRDRLAKYPDAKQKEIMAFHQINIFTLEDDTKDIESDEEMIVTIQNTSLQ